MKPGGVDSTGSRPGGPGSAPETHGWLLQFTSPFLASVCSSVKREHKVWKMKFKCNFVTLWFTRGNHRARSKWFMLAFIHDLNNFVTYDINFPSISPSLLASNNSLAWLYPPVLQQVTSPLEWFSKRRLSFYLTHQDLMHELRKSQILAALRINTPTHTRKWRLRPPGGRGAVPTGPQTGDGVEWERSHCTASVYCNFVCTWFSLLARP